MATLKPWRCDSGATSLAKDECVRVPVTRPVYRIRVVLATCILVDRLYIIDCLHPVMGHRTKYEARATLDPNGLPKIGLPAGFLAHVHRASP